MRLARLLLTGIMLAGVGACATSPEAKFDYDRSVDFGSWQSWMWRGDTPMVVAGADVGPLTQQHVQNVVERVLGLRGYRLEYDGNRAQFAISFTLADSRGMIAGPPSTPGDRHLQDGPWANTAAQAGASSAAMLAIDIHDLRTGRLAWQGRAPLDIGAARRGAAPGQIDAAVTAILAGFPPGAGAPAR